MSDSAAQQAGRAAKRTRIETAWLVDGTGRPVVPDAAVVVEGQRIVASGSSNDVPATPGDTILNFPQHTILPGLVNHHVHLVLPGDGTPFLPWIDEQSDAALAVRAVHNSTVAAACGILTLRDCGGRRSVVVDVRNALSTIGRPGPRILSCGCPLTITGGHTRQFGGESDGVENLRLRIRQLVGAGVDFIKVMASGGGTPGSHPQYRSYTAAELSAIVEEAHAFERKVSAHCIATESISIAIEAGVDGIEHASFLDRDGGNRFDPLLADRLAAAGIVVTPTLQATRDMVDALPDGSERSLWQRRQDAQRQMTSELIRRGVTMLAGSDAGWRETRFDTFWKEIEELTSCGLSSAQAIAAASGLAARNLGLADRTGAIRPGLAADMVLVAGDAAGNVATLRNVAGVMKDGEWLTAPVGAQPATTAIKGRAA